MTVIAEGPGFRVERTDVGSTLIVSDHWTPEAARILASGSVDGLDLNYAKGFKDTDLEFIQPWVIRRLTILARTIKNLTPIYRLSETLESLSVQTAPAATLDLTRMPLLRSLSATWAQVSSTIGDVGGLKEVYLGSFTGSDLSPLQSNSQLGRIRFKDRPRLRTLNGIASMPLVQHLGIYGAPLHDIAALSELDGVHLHELHIESCHVDDLDAVGSAAGLRFLNASECGNVHSVGPLRGLKQLETLWMFGTTDVRDGDLTPISELPRLRELRMKSRKSYRPSVEQIQTAIERGN